MGRKKLVRKVESPSKRGIAWPRWTGFRGMTLRSWLELLVVPLALVVIGFFFSVQQDARQQRIENQRAEAERELAVQRAQDEALQAYLDQMSQLMLDRKLLEAEQGTPLYTLAQARTSTLILRLDSEHNESVTRFLINSGLAVGSRRRLGLEASARLLREITLSHATLSDAYLPNADLRYADLSGANLSDADLNGADLSGANLRGADLSNADLNASKKVTRTGGGGGYIDVVVANLSGANLRGADLYDADLSGAVLSDADLSGANLTLADLSGAKGFTKDQLDQASTLEGATMPNGQKYEEWLKSREGHGG